MAVTSTWARNGSPESLELYQRTVGEWLAAGRTIAEAASGITVAELLAAFWAHAEATYKKPDGTPTKEIENYRQALRPLKLLYGDTPALKFGPLALKAVRQKMLAGGTPIFRDGEPTGRLQKPWTRKNVNHQVARLKHVFKWATENEILPATVHHALSTVAGLRSGAGAAETDPIRPVPAAAIEAARSHVGRHVRAMIDLQLLTGMRPGELCRIRMTDLDLKGPVWRYTPAEHKTAHHGHARIVPMGPKAQDVLRPFLSANLQAYLFNPREAEAERNAARRAARKTPMTPSQAARVKTGGVQSGHFTVDSYRQAIVRACAKATAAARKIDAAAAAVEPWHPHQLRHNAGTRIRAQFGIEAARVVLGHRGAAITEVYAERDEGLAERVAREVG